MNGYGGNILRVNLTTGKITREPTPVDLARDFIGGRGFGAYFLYTEVPAHADPLGPENKLIISSGPISGLLVPGAGKCDFTTKSPLTGGYASSSLGGMLTAELKYAGVDSIILEGISPHPVYLFIENEKVELRDASAYWGQGCITVEKALKTQLGEEFQVAVIGPGGENGVSYACINHDYGREAGRGGVGTVMGAKKLKAIAIRGTHSIPVADLDAYRQSGMALFKACKESDGLKPWQTYGTTIVTSWCDEVGALPTRNFSAGSFEKGASLYGPVMREQIVITDKGCFGCPSPCGKYSRMKRYGTYVEGPEYETIGMLGSNVGISDIQDVAQANLLCDDLGIDTISTGGAIGWAMECFEKGILTLEDTGGLELRFGNVDATLKLIGMIARREGLGAILSQGVKKASQVIGKGSEKFAIHVKGMEQSAYATHNATAMLLAYMTSDVGAHHNRSWAITYDLQVGRDQVVPEKVARIIWLQNFRPMFDVLGACRLQWVELSIDRELYVPVLAAITGIHRSWQDLEKVGARIWNLTRMFWIREIEGFGRAWDLPSPRFYEEPPVTGVTKGQITRFEDVQRLLDMYYEQRGWDANGIPTPETLANLGLKSIID
ncbi:MAG TPA: aldehyde ferredoxin oxidoreductase family protein [Anaerolineaceae bacterium]|nr:aldehyde ferredoxin oxidoreductase family protein [Anaerolineaceae bacterium]HPN51718.1 aldehyde ferredoxin oxidoreductase family protein [Anaerolineaceae bacterium]